MDRRGFLALVAALALAPLRGARAAEQRTGTFDAEVGILYGALSFRLAGTIHETLDRDAGRYDVKIRGQGTGIANAVDSLGVWRDGRWAPSRTGAVFVVYGRESRTEVTYDYGQRTIEYHNRSETFLLRRLRVTDDSVTIPERMHVDDVVSATLNYAGGLWPAQPDGTLLTHVVRRRRAATEGPDDVEKSYRAELVPFVLKVVPDPETGRPTALFDLSRFSSWAREDRPARIVFDVHRRPQTITSSLMLGTSVAIRITGT
ncbi:MAG: hypothetical protein HY002_00480 [Candidatus Rokubacteria bacterium]|nr:hypothetical protein [Candidatus Rokubacteria bacterium]